MISTRMMKTKRDRWAVVVKWDEDAFGNKYAVEYVDVHDQFEAEIARSHRVLSVGQTPLECIRLAFHNHAVSNNFTPEAINSCVIDSDHVRAVVYVCGSDWFFRGQATAGGYALTCLEPIKP